MPRYEVVGFCSDHGGVIVRDVNSKSAALTQMESMKKTIIKDLNATMMARIIINRMSDNVTIKRISVENPDFKDEEIW